MWLNGGIKPIEEDARQQSLLRGGALAKKKEREQKSSHPSQKSAKAGRSVHRKKTKKHRNRKVGGKRELSKMSRGTE